MTTSTERKGIQLTRSLKSRHIFMLSLGGVIGTGLFMGSGVTINQGGPWGAILSYLVAGFLMYLVMVCLGELSVQMPVSGSFQAHATKYIGPATGFMIGWVYWMSWATTVGLEFTAAGMLMQRWFPGVPIWYWSALFVALLFGINALATRAFGEAEYWFAGVKVLAILSFIVVGALVIFGVIDLPSGAPAPMFDNLKGDSLFPNGLPAVFAVMMTVVYAFQGCEIMGVAAGETDQPEKSIPRAVRNVVFRVLIFYVLAVMVLAAIIPWQQAGLVESPFVQVFDMVGIPYAADLMNFVILTAILSVGNSGLYASTRILWAMSKSGMAPKALSPLSKQGVPLRALFITLCFALISLMTSFIAADTLFMVLMAVSGMAGTVTWIVIALAQYRFRRQFLREGGQLEQLKYRAPWFPLVPLLCIVLCSSLFVFLALDETQRPSLYWGSGFIALCYGAYYLMQRKRQLQPAAAV
ncbi:MULTISPECIES: amino acid permease [Pseudomonas]|jgi:arginine/ornithine permease|uniref:Amino-acid permease RocE n=1 Tax=Pseudomonas protegens (strain DSM 19095 / LMG 27888 / CFBP 6595 / CHA0) TaxID=1124983 RepID=A0A2C9ELL0_PSEPH|nr:MULTISPECIES: amino acid permease [Pseudomonas]AGL84542.1 amino-acid permease RocE [Pseudomonas protegens CHA0]MBF0643204.1 amino acid permease [Pseudomonas protegens]MBP5113277.1 amino acid permease [Pseudomonas protegens]MCU1769681.1 amino acid permease [Pseudomonas protegens]MDT9644597.1 amino acid permease [Pseudomonas sp. JV245A]